MTEPTSEYTWVEPKAQHEIDVLLDALDMPPCQRCGAIVETRATLLCWPCTVGNKRAIWRTERPRAAVFDWEGQCARRDAELATLNARLVRARGLVMRLYPAVRAEDKAAIDAFLAETR